MALPTSGAFEYDYTGGVVGDAASGMISLGGHAQVYRRVVTRRVYLDGTTGSLAEVMTYSRPESLLGEDLDYVVVDHYKPDGATRLKQERHYFHGKATDSFDVRPTDYSPWKHGRERQTEALGADGVTVLRRTINTWQQRPAATWFDPNLDGAPPNDPRLIETSTTLMETNHVARQTFSYDQYNNQTDVYEYDFGAGAPGPLIRRTHTDYVTSNNGVDYGGDSGSYNDAGQMIKERFGTNTSLYHNNHYNTRLQLVSTRVGDNATDTMNWSRGAIDFFYGTTAVASGNPFANDTDNNANLRRQIAHVPLAGGGYVIPQQDDYTYDAMNRINSFTEAQMDSGGQWTNNVAWQNFSYAPYGNRQITGASGGISNYNPSYDQATNRISGLGYDEAGNITFDPLTGGTMTYDAENRLLSATSGGGGNYVYNADGKRVRRITGGQEIWHVYGIGGELLAEYAAGAQPTATLKEYGL